MTGRHIRSPSRQAKGRGAPRPAGGSSGSGRRREAGRGQAGDPGHWPGGPPAPAGPGHRCHPYRDLCVATAALAVCRRLPRPEEDIKSHLPLCFSKVESISDPLPHENHVNVLLFISDEARRPAVRERRLAPISAAARRLPPALGSRCTTGHFPPCATATSRGGKPWQRCTPARTCDRGQPRSGRVSFFLVEKKKWRRFYFLS